MEVRSRVPRDFLIAGGGPSGPRTLCEPKPGCWSQQATVLQGFTAQLLPLAFTGETVRARPRSLRKSQFHFGQSLRGPVRARACTNGGNRPSSSPRICYVYLYDPNQSPIVHLMTLPSAAAYRCAVAIVMFACWPLSMRLEPDALPRIPGTADTSGHRAPPPRRPSSERPSHGRCGQ